MRNREGTSEQGEDVGAGRRWRSREAIAEQSELMISDNQRESASRSLSEVGERRTRGRRSLSEVGGGEVRGGEVGERRVAESWRLESGVCVRD